MKPPRLIAWELTNACNLACIHCRASAIKDPAPDELSTAQAKHFVDELVEYKPIIILTGGEPLLRSDVYEIAKYASGHGLRVVLATNGTLLTPDIVKRLKEVGIQRVSISIDGSTKETHDIFRGEPGAFESALRGIDILKNEGLSFQINTTITKRNLTQIPNIYDLAIELGASALHIFLLVPTGRGEDIESDEIPPEEYERVLNWFYDKSKNSPIQLKATCAPHYFRIMRQRAKAEGIRITKETHGLEAMTKGCLGGSGFCFVSSTGNVHPCGYLPALAGNIRQKPFKMIWEKSKVFNDLRDPGMLKGKCGECEYRAVCGGCRARAYALTGDYLDEEPYCTYVPPKKV
ncbi:MAG: heme b synthase [Euryarchaeota archaeon]|nr:heme b synthase [Euryarchaeota archaeon]MBU4220276.1 heme b synthase [Euryarchaeota archaeon]MBU4339679.1 heme b synthase [Euryarchaeota archaeon]MBU4454810.1 heme b synthase [Euryarchaeota archaeon]